MIVVYCREEQHLARLLTGIPDGQTVITRDEWGEFRRDLSRAVCAVIVLEALSDEMAADLAAVRSTCVTTPFVLITWRGASNTRLLNRFPVEEVLWIADLDQIWTAIRCAQSLGLLERTASAIEKADLPRLLRRALALSCRSPLPVRTVKRLAAISECDPATLASQWRVALAPAGDARLQDFLAWLILLGAAGRKTSLRSWADVAEELRVHENTLGRLARRLLGLSLRELAVEGQPAVLSGFRASLLIRLLTPRTVSHFGG